MRRSLFVMFIAASLCGCTSTSGGSSGSSGISGTPAANPPAAVKLANLDGLTHPSPAQVAEYQQALTTLDKGCGGTDDANAALVYATRELEVKDGVHDSELTIAQAVAQTAATGAVKDCKDLFAAFATLRDPG
ncbi:hypothetical protein [Frankia sp. R82]|uniref:hypothetical protein n=1 Tax=Frankia sp. R82 TaxID=2950553 RepID=UPI0020443E6E|nr:hypothetical protein [Frankia sp. R82]MCM3887448.1 hypothetical protein [Frankia sp. R82]